MKRGKVVWLFASYYHKQMLITVCGSLSYGFGLCERCLLGLYSDYINIKERNCEHYR